VWLSTFWIAYSLCNCRCSTFPPWRFALTTVDTSFDLSLRSASWSISHFMEQRLGVPARLLNGYAFNCFGDATLIDGQMWSLCKTAENSVWWSCLLSCWPQMRNRLPSALRVADSIDSFKTGLKRSMHTPLLVDHEVPCSSLAALWCQLYIVDITIITVKNSKKLYVY